MSLHTRKVNPEDDLGFGPQPVMKSVPVPVYRERRYSITEIMAITGKSRSHVRTHVMFELGVRMAQDKPVVLLKAEGTGPLFDMDNMLRVFEYSPNLWQTAVEKDMPDLRDFIKGAWENRGGKFQSRTDYALPGAC